MQWKAINVIPFSPLYNISHIAVDSYGAFSNSDHMKRTFALGDYDKAKHKKAAFSFKKFHKKGATPPKSG